MAWITRGLRRGVLTTDYPSRPDPYADDFHGGIDVRSGTKINSSRPMPNCPTGAIRRGSDGAPLVDRGRCILCGRCVAEQPERFGWARGSEVAAAARDQLVVPRPVVEDVESVRSKLAARTRQFRRSLHIRHVDCGSDGSEEWEISALLNPVYDIHRLGFFFTVSPRHADLLMITGAGARSMLEPLRRTMEATARPWVVMAVGTDAVSGGMITPASPSSGDQHLVVQGDPTDAVLGGLGDALPVDVWVPGSPPSPFMILSGLLLAVGRLPKNSGRR